MLLPSARTTRSSSTPVHAGIHDGRDVLLLQEHRQQAFPVRQPADAEVTQERLRGYVGQLHLLLQARLAQPVGEVEQVLISSAEAPGSLARAHHDVSRILQEAPPPLPGADSVIQGGNRVRVAVRAEPGHRAEVVAVTGGDNQVVIVVGTGGRSDLLRGQVDPGRLGVNELDPVVLERRRERERDVRGAALTEREPDQRRLNTNRSDAEITRMSTSPCSSWLTASAAVSPPKFPPSTSTFLRLTDGHLPSSQPGRPPDIPQDTRGGIHSAGSLVPLWRADRQHRQHVVPVRRPAGSPEQGASPRLLIQGSEIGSPPVGPGWRWAGMAADWPGCAAWPQPAVAAHKIAPIASSAAPLAARRGVR